MIDRTPGRKVVASFLPALFVLGTAVAVAGIPQIVYDGIYRCRPDGSSVQKVIPKQKAEGRRVLAVGAQHLFWLGGSVQTYFGNFPFLRRAGLGGQSQQDLVGPAAIGGMAIDKLNSKIYMTPQSDCAPGCTSIARSNLQGLNVEFLFPAGFPEGIAVDPSRDLVCWYDLFFGDDFIQGIACGTLGEPEGEIVVADEARSGVALDPINAKLYWAKTDRIRRANLDGSNIEDVVVGLDDVAAITLDPAGNRMWWTERAPGRILRARLDGSEVEVIVSDLDSPSGIGFYDAPGGPAGDRLYWLAVGPSLPVPAGSVWGALAAIAIVLLTSAAILRRRGTAPVRMSADAGKP